RVSRSCRRTVLVCFFFQAEDGIRDWSVTGVQTCALPIYARRPRAVHLAGEELNSRPPSEGRARGVAPALPTKTRAPGCTQLHGPLDTAARARRRPSGRTASGMGIGFLGKGVEQKVIPLHLPPMSPTPTSAVAFCPVPIESGQYAPVAGRAWVGTTLT